MSDERLRELERRWRDSGDPGDEARYLGARLRAGGLERRALALAAFLGHPAARAVLSEEAVERLPAALFRPDPLALASAPEGLPGCTVEVLDERLSVLLRLAGPLRGRTAERVALALEELHALGVGHLLVHVGDATSEGFGLLVQQAGELFTGARRLSLVALPRKLEIIIDVIGLSYFFDVYPDVAAALASRSAEPAEPDPSPSPATRLRRLVRWGTEACVRAALALAHEEEAHRVYDRRQRQLAAAQAALDWLRDPTPARRAAAAEEAAAPGRGPGGARPTWSGAAAATIARGIWPRDLPPVGRRDLAVVRDHLVPWALGEGDGFAERAPEA